MKAISENSIPHYLVLFGEEQAILDIYIQHIAQNYKIVYCDTVAYALSQVGKKSIDKSNKVYIVNEDNAYNKVEESWKNVKQTFARSKHILLLKYHSIDKRGKFYTQNKGNAVEFTHLSEDVLINYIQQKLPALSEKNASKLIIWCNYDYGRILMEIDKIQQWVNYYTDKEGTPNTDSAFKLLNKQGLFYKEIGDITFELTNAVLGGYPDTAIQKLEEAKRKGEPAMMIASILYTGFRNLLAYQGLGNNKQNAMERTGMTKGELYGCTKNVGGYSIAEVRRNMLFCQKIETGIKQGIVDEDVALEYLILHCLR
jgi:DNA polymerase III delta subunit|nr:MAG TPA: DNA polymerase III, delta subunit [Caudoviricetes sp.]